MRNISLRAKIIIAGVFGLIALVLYVLYSYSFVNITVINSADGNIKYLLTAQGNSDPTETDGPETTLRKLVRRGSYEVLVRQGESSYFAVIKSEGFLGSKNVEARLTTEKSRVFIGNNPSSCLYNTPSVLFSSDCGDSVDRINQHVPATASLPTYTEKISTPLNGFVEDSVNTVEGTLVLVESPGIAEDEGAPHVAYLLGSEDGLVDGFQLSGLIDDRRYFLTPDDQGFIAYSGDHALRYSSRKSEPVAIDVPPPDNKTLRLHNLSSQGDSLVFIYGEGVPRLSPDIASGIEGPHAITDGSNSPSTEVVVVTNNQSKHFEFESEVETTYGCGNNKVCVLNEGVLKIFDVSQDKASELFKLTSVVSVEPMGGELLVVRAEGVLRLDLDSRTGALDYSFGDYTTCGIKSEGDDYLLCIGADDQSVVYVDSQQNNTDSIDKKINSLLNISEVTDLSVYKNFVYVSADYGELEYIEGEGFTYSASTVQSVNAKVREEAMRNGIDLDRYRIVNAFE